MEKLDDKYRCKTHSVQAAVPCFKVNTLIGDEFSDVTVTVMGNQAEQLFGSKLETLRSKRVYVSEQIVPPEISAVIGQVHVFEVKGNAYDEWLAVAIGPKEDDVSITPSMSDAETSSATPLPEMTLQTPEKPCVQQKRILDEGTRTLDDSTRTLFPDTKKGRRETKGISAPSTAMQEKDRLD